MRYVCLFQFRNDGVQGAIRAPPMLLPMAEAATCQPTNQVQVEQVPNEVLVASVKKENTRKKPKRMTPRRREIIFGFFLEVHVNLGKYGNVGGPTWMNELLLRIRGESGRFDYVQVQDVMNWLNLAEFKEVSITLKLLQCSNNACIHTFMYIIIYFVPFFSLQDYENLLKLEKERQGSSLPTSSASMQPLQNGEPIGFNEPVQITPPIQPAPFTTAATATAQVKNPQPDPASSNVQGIVGDDGIIYQTQLPQHSTYFVNHMGLPILPNDLWQHTKEENQQQGQPEVFFQPGGILLQLPPSATTTTLYIHPTSWAAYVSKGNENSGGATGTNEEIKLGVVKQEKDQEQKKEEEENAGSDFSGDQFMGYMGGVTDVQD